MIGSNGVLNPALLTAPHVMEIIQQTQLKAPHQQMKSQIKTSGVNYRND